jgi:formylglycine-generating enzyme required for sulfatase activity
LGVSAVYGLVLLVKPRWLLWLPGQLKIPNTSIELPSGFLLWLKYRPRVLDCWVKDHWEEAQERFARLDTVRDRAIHISIQVWLDGEPIDTLTPAHLRPIFERANACVLLVGEGGVGKTSLACRIAHWGLQTAAAKDSATDAMPLASHRMLPVLIEQELGEPPLLTAIQEQLPRTADGSYINPELLTALLRQRRALVILDHVSELSDAGYQALRAALDATPINALIITSRLRDKALGRSAPHVVEPQKIEGERLSAFIQPYLIVQGKRNLFDDDGEFFSACTRLSRMMAATLQKATALLVRLYVDQIIDVGGLKTAQLPDDIPELMLRYLCWLNRPEQVAAEHRRENDAIRRDAQAVAWACLQATYRPGVARRETVLATLAAVASTTDPATVRLAYLQSPLGLVQVSAAETTVRIVLDPVAEYLAALQVVDYCQTEVPEPEEIEDRWQLFLESVAAQGDDLAVMRGFLLAVHNACEPRRKQIPPAVLDQLNDWAALDEAALEQARRRQRINKLIDDLYDSDDRYLTQAIQNLAQEGAYGTKAIPDLTKLLKSDRPETAVRIEAITALIAIQTDRAALKDLLQQTLAQRQAVPEVRVAALQNLVWLALSDPEDGAEDCGPLLHPYFADETEVGVVRVQAGEGLRKLGQLQDLLVVTVEDAYHQTIELVPPPKTTTVDLPGAVPLTLVQIPAGTFWMGSEATEAGSYSDERPQHQVTLGDFWLGQFAVTQAQYEAVMGRNPATFRTDPARPVETVSWYDATDFCQKLSELTEQEFRLPSEAEWEYACRAGTTTPFHCGPTITTDLANYRGTDEERGGQVLSGAYGNGPHGIYREQTVPIGQFPPNPWGLYDLHGNVWEWCQDVWHNNYDSAPNDGSAWLAGADQEDRRVLRGGAWVSGPGACRSAFRDSFARANRNVDVGFRVLCVASPGLP